MLYVVLLVLHGISSRAVAAIWYCTLCDRYAITMFLPGFLITLHDGYFWALHRVSAQP